MYTFNQPYIEDKQKMKCVALLSGEEKLGSGKKGMGMNRKQEIGGGSPGYNWRDKQEERGDRFVGEKCMQEEERSDLTLAGKHLHVWPHGLLIVGKTALKEVGKRPGNRRKRQQEEGSLPVEIDNTSKPRYTDGERETSHALKKGVGRKTG